MGGVQLIKEEINDGTINQIRKDRIWVVLDQACNPEEGCKAGCGACGGNGQVKKIMIRSASSNEFTIGQKVTVRRFILNEILGAFMVFGVPLLCAIFTILTWYIVAPQRAESPVALLSTGVAFSLGFGITGLADIIFRTHYPTSLQRPSGDQS